MDQWYIEFVLFSRVWSNWSCNPPTSFSILPRGILYKCYRVKEDRKCIFCYKIVVIGPYASRWLSMWNDIGGVWASDDLIIWITSSYMTEKQQGELKYSYFSSLGWMHLFLSSFNYQGYADSSKFVTSSQYFIIVVRAQQTFINCIIE